MAETALHQAGGDLTVAERGLADRAFTRATGAPLVAGNLVRPLRDAAENYPAWLEAFRSAQRHIHFESYILHGDHVGREFAGVLAEQARRGVRVRIIYDWLGAVGATPKRFWKPLLEAGAEVRCFNPARFANPFGWISRDHRKTIAVDGRVAFVTGLCVGRMWAGDPAKGREPWRDTGVELRGPAVADVERAFWRQWARCGDPYPKGEVPRREDVPPAGNMHVRVVASEPQTTGLYRLDQLIAAAARERLWLTDAYFVGTAPYVAALRAAARDGVDVRMLVPGASDLPWLRPLTRAGYRPLLEAGVRVFEWNGPMLHAKSAVADGFWARVGSSNLNVQSWMGNWELDLAVEDVAFAAAMERMYEDDLENATEIVLEQRRASTLIRSTGPERRTGHAGAKTTRAAAGAMRIGRAVGAALAARRVLAPTDVRLLFWGGVVLLFLAGLAVVWPWWVAVPFALVTAWLALTALVRSARLLLARRRPDPPPDDPQGMPAA